MDPKGFENKPWFPYVKNMYDEIEEDIMSVDAKGYEEKPWWPYVLDLQEKIDAGGGGGGSSDLSTATANINVTGSGVGLPIPNIMDDMLFNSYGKLEIGTESIQVVLYKGRYSFYNDPMNYMISNLSGSVSYDEDEDEYIITGDCSFDLAFRS